MKPSVLSSCNELNHSTENSKIPLFSRPAWFQLFEHYIPLNGKVAILKNHHEDSEPFFLALTENTSKRIVDFKFLQSMSNFYTPIFDMAGNADFSQQDYLHISQNYRGYFNQFDRIDMLPMYQYQAKNWITAFRNIGFKGFIYQHSTNWYQDNIDSIEHYWSLRPSRLRNTLKRKRDKLNREGHYRIIIPKVESLTELRQLLADYHNVYFDSWKIIEPYPGFIDSIATYAWQHNELRIGLAYHHNTPVAAQIWFVNGETAYIYKLAHRKSYSEQSVGTVLTAAMFEHVIEQDKVTCVDFLTGDDSYKKDWMNKSRPLYGIQLCNTRTLIGWFDIMRNQISGFRKKMKKASAK